MFHTVYLSFEPDGRDYIGKHSSEDPYDDYLGSYKDKSFDPTNKIILEYSKTEEGAVEAEIRWQKVFKVAENPQFANQSYQTNRGFVLDTRGEKHPLYGTKRPDVMERNLKDNPSRRPGASEKIAEARRNAPPDSDLTRKKKGRSVRERIDKDPEYQSKIGSKAASLKFMDPDHPELGVQNAGNLAQMQARRGYPQNKVEVQLG
jgi:hypothetical protein